MATEQCVSKVERIFLEEYPKLKMTTERHLLWMGLLKGVDDRHVTAAAMHIISTRSDWPPDIALLRCTALSIATGELKGKTGAEAWLNICNYRDNIQEHGTVGEDNISHFRKQTVLLTSREVKAYEVVGNLNSYKGPDNSVAARARYIEAYDALASSAKKEREMLPDVAELNAVNEDVPKQLGSGMEWIPKGMARPLGSLTQVEALVHARSNHSPQECDQWTTEIAEYNASDVVPPIKLKRPATPEMIAKIAAEHKELMDGTYHAERELKQLAGNTK